MREALIILPTHDNHGKGTSHDFMRYEGSIKPEWIVDAREITPGEMMRFALQGLLDAA